MTQEEKNIKLLELAGFTEIKGIHAAFNGYWLPPGITIKTGTFEDTTRKKDLPNLFLSMDACEEYLIPKINFNVIWIINNLDAPTSSLQYCAGFVRGKDHDLICWSKDLDPDKCLSPICSTMPSALCEAVGKAFKLWE